MKYRPHRRLLDESMAEVVEFENRAALIEHLRKDFASWGVDVQDADIRVEPYGYDDRINWNTHIVCLKNKEISPGRWYFGSMQPDFFGAIGWTDGPAP